MDVGFEVEARIGGLEAHAGRFHVDRLEVHGVDGQRAAFLVGVLLIDLDLFETGGIAGIVLAGVVGLRSRRGGAGLVRKRRNRWNCRMRTGRRPWSRPAGCRAERRSSCSSFLFPLLLDVEKISVNLGKFAYYLRLSGVRNLRLRAKPTANSASTAIAAIACAARHSTYGYRPIQSFVGTLDR